MTPQLINTCTASFQPADAAGTCSAAVTWTKDIVYASDINIAVDGFADQKCWGGWGSGAALVTYRVSVCMY